ncbi:MAG: hypothetical protein IIX97_06090 [Clostridia bacterium]|nr:hypothetical protein [Clostridia bacterium]
MKEKLFYIKDKKLFYVKDGKGEPVPDGVYEGYLRRVTDSAKRNEWKNTGRGAMFTGAYAPGADSSSVASSVRSDVTCVGKLGDMLIFSEKIGDTCAIYRKTSVGDMSEVIALSDTSYSLETFDCAGEKIAVSASYANFSHIGLAEPSGRGGVRIITEGESIDKNPSFDKRDPDVLYYESAGILLTGEEEQRDDRAFLTPADMMRSMRTVTQTGPSAIVRIDFARSALDYILEDDSVSYIKPSTDTNGVLYFIKRPYVLEEKRGGGCLLSILLIPVKLIKAIGGFFNFFSMKYSGQTLTSNGSKAKGKDARTVFIDGNLIDAEKSLKENAGEQNPGVIPKSFELCRLVDGRVEKVKSGVIAYTFDADGNIVYSNGNAIIRLYSDGREERVVKDRSAEGVTMLRFIEIDD